MTFSKKDIGAGCLYVALFSRPYNGEILNIQIHAMVPLCEIIW